MAIGRRVGAPQGCVLGALLVASVVAWKLGRSTYQADVGAICQSERLAGLSVRRDMAGVTERTRDRLETSKGNAFFSGLRDLPIGARADRLQDEAGAVGVRSCPMAETYRQLAREAEYRSDVQRLCSYATFPGLGELDDGARVEILADWIREAARSDRAHQLGAILRREATSVEAARALRDAAAEIDVFTCDTAKVLDASPARSCLAGASGLPR
jgi:hypothetical protein